MATAPNPQFRFVRCPKCCRVLPEVPNVPVYGCGGCGALLQAKSRKKDADRPESRQQEATDHVSGDEEASRLNDEANPSSSNCSVDYNNDEDQGCKAEEHETVDLSSNETHKNGDFGSEDCDMEAPGIESEAYSSTELVCNIQEPKDSSPFSSQAKPIEEESHNELGSTIVKDHNLLPEAEAEPVAAHVPLSESTLPAPRGAVQGFGSMRSIYTSGGATEYASPESEFSPAARGSRAYEASISSCDDQFPKRYVHSMETTHHMADKLRRDQFLLDSMASIDSQVQHQPKTKLYDKGWDREEAEEPARACRPPRNLMRAERNDIPPKVPLHRRSFQAAGYGSSSSFSSRAHEDNKWDLGFSSSGKLEYQRQEKMKLLRMIRELQDQLDKSCNMEGNANGRVSVGGASTCYDHMEETWHQPNYQIHPVSRLGCNSAQQSNLARTSFSCEAPNSRHHIGRQCLHCHPQDWKHSAPLPPVLCHSTGVPSGYACCNPESSSPRRYAESAEFSAWSRETKSGDQRLHVMRKYTREKPVVAKKHFRPKAGGAPFITCYRCSKLLQLPEDFLLFKRRYYKLQCGACSTVLKFSVQNRTHIIPYSSTDVHLDPPPSEADECSGVMNRRSSGVMNRRSAASSSSHRGYSCPHVDPHSYSDHPRLTWCKICSSEGDLHALPDNSSHDRKMSYASSLYSMEKRREFIQNQSRNKYKDPVEEDRPSSSKSKAERSLTETEVQRQQRSNSPLHRLMGYSSPSLVIRGIGMSPAGTSS